MPSFMFSLQAQSNCLTGSQPGDRGCHIIFFRRRNTLGLAVILICFLCTLACENKRDSAQKGKGALTISANWTPSVVAWDIPTEITDKDTTAHVWLPSKPPNGETIHVHVISGSQLEVSPSAFDLGDTKPQVLNIKRLNTKPALVQLALEVEIAGNTTSSVQEIDRVINLGFHPVIKFAVPSQVSGGATVGFTVKTVDETGKSISMPAPVFLLLRGVNVKFAEGASDPQNPLRVDLSTGANSTPPLKLIPERILSGGTGSLQVELHGDEDYVISESDSQDFTIPVALRLQFAMAILGGLLNSVYATILLFLDHGTENWKTVGARAGIGVIAGVLTVLFADKAALLGVSLQGPSLVGYVAAGFLVAYLGIDAFFARARLAAPAGANPGKSGGTV